MLREYSPETIERVRQNVHIAGNAIIYLGIMNETLKQRQYKDSYLLRVKGVSNDYGHAYNIGVAMGIDICTRERLDTDEKSSAYSDFLADVRTGRFRAFEIRSKLLTCDMVRGIEQTCRDFAIAKFVRNLEEVLVLK